MLVVRRTSTKLPTGLQSEFRGGKVLGPGHNSCGLARFPLAPASRGWNYAATDKTVLTVFPGGPPTSISLQAKEPRWSGGGHRQLLERTNNLRRDRIACPLAGIEVTARLKIKSIRYYGPRKSHEPVRDCDIQRRSCRRIELG